MGNYGVGLIAFAASIMRNVEKVKHPTKWHKQAQTLLLTSNINRQI